MRENRPSGLEGGEGQSNDPSLPLSSARTNATGPPWRQCRCCAAVPQRRSDPTSRLTRGEFIPSRIRRAIPGLTRVEEQLLRWTPPGPLSECGMLPRVAVIHRPNTGTAALQNAAPARTPTLLTLVQQRPILAHRAGFCGAKQKTTLTGSASEGARGGSPSLALRVGIRNLSGF